MFTMLTQRIGTGLPVRLCDLPQALWVHKFDRRALTWPRNDCAKVLLFSKRAKDVYALWMRACGRAGMIIFVFTIH